MSTYDIVRNVINFILYLGLAIAILYIFKHYKIKQLRIRYCIISAVVCFALVFAAAYPFENFIFSFNSAEDAFHYKQKEVIASEITNTSSSMVIYKAPDSGGYNELVIPMNDNGCYKIPTSFMLKKELYNIEHNNVCTVYKVNGCDDYYLVGLYYQYDNKLLSIKDNLNSQIIVYTNSVDDQKNCKLYYYAKIDKHKKLLEGIEDYYVTIGDERFYLN